MAKQERNPEMSRTKALISILTVLILITLSAVSVWAAPGRQEPTEEPTEEPTPEPTEEPTGEPTEEPTAEPTEEPIAVHPVVSALAEFFAETLGLDYDTIMGYHEDGMGFGVIAQACWMAYAMEGDAALLGDILEAKRSGDFGSITLPNGETPKNWGQFRKAALGNDKAKKNLGTIMSGRANGEQEQEQEQEQEMTATQAQGKDKGGGKPDTPPGQDKDKGKGGGKGKDK
jgi:hypothetical protein